MRRKKTTVLLALLLIVGMTAVVFVVPSVASPSADISAYEPLRVGPEIRDADFPIQEAEALAGEAAGDGDDAVVLDTKDWLSADFYTGYYFWSSFELRAESEYTQIWVQIWEERGFPDGDPRGTPIITQGEVEYLLGAFDSNIYPTDSDYFGEPFFRDGSGAYFDPLYWYDETGRNVILVSNFGDENYYDPDYPYYVAGFFSSSLRFYHGRNIISIDTWAWEDRIGPEGTEWLPGETVDRPFTYEAIIAHEEQHLIHSDYQPGDDLYINEGCSMFAEVLCGYGVPWGDINSYLATPDNSLTVWEDQGGINILADYGAAALWAIYLNDQFGETFWSDYMVAGIPGTPGMEALFGGMTFDEVFHNWRIANLIHSDWPGGGIYNYNTMDLGEGEPARLYEVQKLPVPWTTGSSFGTTVSILGYDTGVSDLAPYGTDYVALTKWQKKKPWMKFLKFDGDDTTYVEPSPDQWTFDGTYWYSGAVDLLDIVIAGEMTVGGDGMLSMTTYWDIEDYWDFGFVQVSTDDGATWTSLENTYTTYLHDPEAIQTAVDNLPGLTGWSGDFITIEFDLTAYMGMDVLIGFRYVTDWGTLYEGWYIEDTVTVGDVPLELDVWYPPPPEADFMVSLVYYMKCRRNYYPVWVSEVGLNDDSETGFKWIPISKPAFVVLVVSSVSDAGTADYSFKVDYKHKHHCWKWHE